jgi:hypothetical protein
VVVVVVVGGQTNSTTNGQTQCLFTTVGARS